jgi:DNA-binding NarL/FixJ family response regulator
MMVVDHDGHRRLLSEWIDQELDLEVVARVGSLGEGRYQASSQGCDMAVVDLGFPDGNGADLIAELRELCPGCAVLILSDSMDPSSLARASEAGAEQIMDKLDDIEEVDDAIRRLGKISKFGTI